MKKSPKIIQISGFRGILTALFIIVCLAAGFVAFPGLVAMNLWNRFLLNYLPHINIYQGVLLWGIVALTGFIANKQRFAVSFQTPRQLSNEEVSLLMSKIKKESEHAKSVLKNIEEAKKEITPEETVSEKETVTK